MSLIRKKKDADDTAQKSAIEHTFKCSQLLAFVILYQSEKHLETSITRNQEENVVDELESVEVQDVKVMANLKSVVTKASHDPEKVVSKTLASS